MGSAREPELASSGASLAPSRRADSGACDADTEQPHGAGSPPLGWILALVSEKRRRLVEVGFAEPGPLLMLAFGAGGSSPSTWGDVMRSTRRLHQARAALRTTTSNARRPTRRPHRGEGGSPRHQGQRQAPNQAPTSDGGGSALQQGGHARRPTGRQHRRWWLRAPRGGHARRPTTGQHQRGRLSAPPGAKREAPPRGTSISEGGPVRHPGQREAANEGPASARAAQCATRDNARRPTRRQHRRGRLSALPGVARGA